jgi:hypothetical protein
MPINPIHGPYAHMDQRLIGPDRGTTRETSLPNIDSSNQMGRQAEEVVEHFRKNNIILPHPFSPIGEYVFVSLGTRKDMPEFWRVWDLLPSQKMSM